MSDDDTSSSNTQLYIAHTSKLGNVFDLDALMPTSNYDNITDKRICGGNITVLPVGLFNDAV
jgi:hypothetical protein